MSLPAFLPRFQQQSHGLRPEILEQEEPLGEARTKVAVSRAPEAGRPLTTVSPVLNPKPQSWKQRAGDGWVPWPASLSLIAIQFLAWLWKGGRGHKNIFRSSLRKG